MKLKQRSAPKNPEIIFAWERLSKLIGPAVSANHPGVDRCLGFIAKKFREPIQIADLVEVSGMSRRGFCKAFNRCLGANPGAVLRHVRIEQAKRLLMEHDLLLRQVAKSCGYRSENSFCVAFQRTVGMPPKKFQRQYRLAIGSRQRQGRVDDFLLLPASDSTIAASLSVGTGDYLAGISSFEFRKSGGLELNQKSA